MIPSQSSNHNESARYYLKVLPFRLGGKSWAWKSRSDIKRGMKSADLFFLLRSLRSRWRERDFTRIMGGKRWRTWRLRRDFSTVNLLWISYLFLNFAGGAIKRVSKRKKWWRSFLIPIANQNLISSRDWIAEPSSDHLWRFSWGRCDSSKLKFRNWWCFFIS